MIGDYKTQTWLTTPKAANSRVLNRREHVATTWNGETVRTFVNGKLAQSVPVPNSLRELKPKGIMLLGLSPIRPNAPIQAFSGWIDQVRISNSSRYETDFTPADPLASDSNTLALYRFAEGTGDVLKDSSGNNQHGKIVGAKWITSKTPPSGIAATNTRQPTQWLEVVPVFDVKKDVVHEEGWTVRNQWEMRDGALTYVSDGKSGKIKLPVEVSGREMEVRLEFTALEPNAAFNFDVPADEGSINFDFGSGSLKGLGSLTGGRPPQYVKGQRTKVVLRVERNGSTAHVRTEIDGKSVIDWTGDVNQIVFPFSRTKLDPRSIGLFAHKGSIAFHSIQIGMLSGSARLTPGGSPNDSTWLEMLPLIDPQRDRLEYPMLTGANDWSMTNGELIYKGDSKAGNLIFPVRIEGPNVEIECELTRTNGGSNLTINLPTKKGPLPVGISNAGSNVQLGWPPAQVGKFSQKTGQRTKYLCKIAKIGDKDVIDVYADGASIGHWEGDRHAIGKPDPTNFPQETSSGFWIQPNSNWTFHRIRIRTPGGTVTPTKLKQAAAINLLNTIDTSRDAVPETKSNWKIEKGVLSGSGGRVYLPVEPIPDAYDVRLRVERKSAGNALVLGLVSGGKRVALILGGFGGDRSGLENIDGKGPTNNGTAVEARPFNLNQPSDIVVQVRKSGIRVERDGQPFIDWKGNADRLSLGSTWTDPGPAKLFLGAQAKFEVHQLEFTPIAPVEAGWVNLFNGKDLSGWKAMGFDGWSVANGLLSGTTLKAQQNGWLMSDQDYSDFDLEFEYKLETGANSGVLLRAWPGGKVDGSQFPEIQLLDDDAPKFASLTPDRRTGSLYALVAPKPAPKTPAKQWHRVRVQLQGQQLEVRINDVVVLKHAVADMRPSGRIGLQLHTGQMEFRNIRIRSLK